MLEWTPLAGPECRWAVARTWLFVVRWIVGLAVLGVLLAVAWFCWFSSSLDPTFLPGDAFRVALKIAFFMILVCVFLLAPAVLAGTFSSDSQHGAIGILLTTRVSAGEIVFSRFLSRLYQVGIVAVAGLPGLFFLAIYSGVGLQSLAVLLLLTAAVACGSGGVAVSLSVLFKRGRDALICTYVFGLSLLFLSGHGWDWMPAAITPWVKALNPFLCLHPLIDYGQTQPAWHSILDWSVLAACGVLLASWRLRPTYLRRAGGTSKVMRRRRKVPPLNGCPIRWKELHIESDKDFGRLARVLGRLALLLMLGGSVVLLGLYVWSAGNRRSPEIVTEVLAMSAVWIKSLLLPMSWLVQWAVGIRAAAGIATEKERGTWDALMMTPLGGWEIVKAKMMESYYGLRWFLIATLIVWLLGVLLETIDLYDALGAVASIGLMSAVGVWSSLNAKTSGRAIILTLAGWLAGKFLFNVAAILLVLVAMLGQYLIWAAIRLINRTTLGAMPQPLMSFETAMTIFELALTVGATIAIAWYCRLRFDRLAGRCPARPVPVQLVVAPKNV